MIAAHSVVVLEKPRTKKLSERGKPHLGLQLYATGESASRDSSRRRHPCYRQSVRQRYKVGVLSLRMRADGGTTIYHAIEPPMAYLDHWALMEVAEGYAPQFRAALKRRRGTLALSWVNFLELSAVSERTAEPVKALLRDVFPQVALIQVETGAVVRAEDDILAGRRKTAALLHDEWLDIYAGIRRRGNPNPLDPGEFVAVMQSTTMKSAFRRMLRQQRREILPLFAKARAQRNDAATSMRLKRPLPRLEGSVFSPTRFAFFEGMRYLIKNDLNLSSGNHLMDFWHTVVPISYADYVLLDKNWKEAALQIQRALQPKGLLTHHASVHADIPEFLWHLEHEVTYR